MDIRITVDMSDHNHSSHQGLFIVSIMRADYDGTKCPGDPDSHTFSFWCSDLAADGEALLRVSSDSQSSLWCLCCGTGPPHPPQPPCRSLCSPAGKQLHLKACKNKVREDGEQRGVSTCGTQSFFKVSVMPKCFLLRSCLSEELFWVFCISCFLRLSDSSWFRNGLSHQTGFSCV
ncbi:Hypothetical predicted protein [Xyrichtys novacula]|uniref:Uncharacterized protein n=1 Tax=Xyrichtys novacula TaxID=13765 RepID=A0AAV1HKA0_XYRNO|nr:Hypothetical predicted protein [Xyrichtys novacula]